MSLVHNGGEGIAAPFVSFLTTAYRTDQYVSETIESVLAQTRGDWELIVVDSGNSDEMAAVALGGLNLSPGLLAAIHPAKNRLASALRRAHYWMLCQLRGEAPTRLEWVGPRAPLEGEL
jgi:hypothetical protein